MSEVLDQSEIDALLTSVADDDPEPAIDAADVGEHAAVERLDQIGVDVDASVYDFKRPERVSRDQIRALSSIHEVFARNFGATLSGILRTIVDVRVVGVEQLTYNEFIHSLPNPTAFSIIEAPPLEGRMCLELSPLIVFPIVDRLLGGTNAQTYIPQRPLTSIEWGLIDRIVDRALELLSEVWRNLLEVRFERVQTESNPQLVHIVAPTEVVVFITFEIKLSQAAGTMSMCVPFNTIEAVLSRLTTQSWFYKPKTATERQQQRLLRNLVKGSIDLVAYLGQTSIRLSELRALRSGDLLQLDKRTDRELILQIAGKNKFAGSAGRLRGRRAFRLKRSASIDEPL